MTKQYWVIGGEYRDTGFQHIVDGTSRVYGPFTTYDEARSAWRDQANETRHLATTRFTIVSNVSVGVQPLAA